MKFNNYKASTAMIHIDLHHNFLNTNYQTLELSVIVANMLLLMILVKVLTENKLNLASKNKLFFIIIYNLQIILKDFAKCIVFTIRINENFLNLNFQHKEEMLE